MKKQTFDYIQILNFSMAKTSNSQSMVPGPAAEAASHLGMSETQILHPRFTESNSWRGAL